MNCCFKFFCIFNRLSDPWKLPLEISPIGLNFILKSLGVKIDVKLKPLQFHEFLAYIEELDYGPGKGVGRVSTPEKLYLELVEDVIIQAELKCKLKRYGIVIPYEKYIHNLYSELRYSHRLCHYYSTNDWKGSQSEARKFNNFDRTPNIFDAI